MAVELKLPELGENIDSGQVVKLLVAVGDMLVKDQPVIELETGKASVEVPATASGKVTALLVKQGDTIKVGQAILTLDEGPAAPAPSTPSTPSTASTASTTSTPSVAVPPPAATAPGSSSVAAPHVRQFAREIGVDLHAVVGSGPGGRISLEDVKQHAREGSASPRSVAAVAGQALPVVALPNFSRFGAIERVPLSQVRQLTAQQMQLSWSTIPHVMLEADADATDMEAFRLKHKEQVEAAGGKLTVTALLVKVVAAALRAFPNVNASLDAAAKELVLKKYVHVGVATDTPRGLLVPVVRDADQKSVQQLAVDIHQLTEKARAGKLGLAEMQGGCFSVTNLGGMGIGHFTAVINAPEVAILAVGKAVMRPVWNGSALAPRLVLPLSLSIDHRVLDGADGARFLKWVVEAIEQPFLLAL